MPAKHAIRVQLLPELAQPEHLREVCVVIDVLRATTSIIEALASGADSIWPCLEVEEARAVADASDTGCLLAGERVGLKIPGFDLGNSPGEFSPAVVAGKRIAMTTTNGTKAILRCRDAERVVIGAFTNLSAVVELLARQQSNVDLVCAGTDGAVTLEDTLFAGAVIFELGQRRQRPLEAGNDAARIARTLWETCRPLTHDLLLQSQGGRNVRAIGQLPDLDIAAQVDRQQIVPLVMQSDSGNLLIRTQGSKRPF